MKNYSEHITPIEEKLIEAEKKARLFSIIFYSILFIAGTAGLVFFVSLFESLFYLEITGRTVLALLFLGSEISLAIYLLVYRIIIKRTRHTCEEHCRTAEEAGIYFPAIKDNLKNLLQIAYGSGEGASAEIVEAVLKQGADEYSGYDFTRMVTFGARRNSTIASAAAVFMIALLFLISPSLRSAAERVINYSNEYAPPARFYFIIKPGNSAAAKGEDVKIEIRVKEKESGSISLFIKPAEESRFSEKTVSASGGVFYYTVVNANSSFQYYASVEGFNSQLYEITVLNRPVIQEINIKLIPPAYTRLPAETLKDNGSASAIKGTRIEFSLKSSRPLRSAAVKIKDSTILNMRVSGINAFGEMTLKKDMNYYFELTGSDGNRSINPVVYTLQCIQDEYPSVGIYSPGKEIKSAVGEKVGISYQIKDDFGFSRCGLKYKISYSPIRKAEEEYNYMPIPFKTQPAAQELSYLWDTGKLNLNEGETVSWFIEVTDNDIISGPKKTAGEIYYIKIPSLNDVSESIEKKEGEIEKELAELLKDAEKAKEELRRTAGDLKKDKRELTWEEKNSISKTLENVEKVQRGIEETKEKLDEIKKEMSGSRLFSKETVEKYRELQKMFEELNSEEFRQAIMKMQDALKSMMRDNVQNAMEKLEGEEEFLRNSIERTMNLLKRIKVEMKIDELIKRTDALAGKVNEINNKMKNADLGNAAVKEEMENRQEDLTKGLKSLGEEMRYAEHLMNGLDNMPLEEIKKIRSEASKQNNENISEEARSAIERGRKENASAGNAGISKNLSSLSKMMSGMKKSFQQMNQMKTFSEMMKAFSNLIALSREQEKLLKETEALSYSPERLKAKSVQQNSIKNSLLNVIRSITELSQKTMGITPETGEALGRGYSQMQEAVNALNGGGGSPHSSMRGAMEGINKGAAMLKGSMDRMMGGGAGGGMASLMQQLQDAAQQQMKLNQMTRELGSGGLTQQELAEMQRLARTQEIIRKSLERINREAMEAGRSKSLAGSLEKTIEEMRALVSEMERNPAGTEIIKRQEKILTRMLDSQRSLTEKDFEKERESKTGGVFNAVSPGPMDLSKEKRSKYEEELIRALKDEYRKDYEQLIKRYLELLEKKERK